MMRLHPRPAFFHHPGPLLSSCDHTAITGACVENTSPQPSPPPGDQVVRFRPPSGRIRYLIRAHREACRYCNTGTRVISLWAIGTARAEEVAWCGHCFNATCEPVRLSEEQQLLLQSLRQNGEASGRTWAAVRPALEDLERRGLF
jgi:hypothetical protein